MSEGYSTNLDDLYDIGSINLPDARDHIDVAIGHLREAASTSRGAFSGDADLFGELAPAWQHTFAQLYPPMTKCRESLDLAAEAIRAIEKRYRILEGEE